MNKQEPVAWQARLKSEPDGKWAWCDHPFSNPLYDFRPLYASPAPSTGERELRLSAQAVVDRWDTPLWKDVPATAEFINRLRAALASPGRPVGDGA